MNYRRIAVLFALSVLMSVRSAPAEVPPEYAVVLNNQGVRALNEKQWDLAIDKLSKALLTDPNYRLARENLAIAHNNYGRYIYIRSRNKSEAFKQFHQSAYLCPDFVSLTNLRAIIRMFGKDPDSFTDHLKLADRCNVEGDLVSAFVEYRAALKLKLDSQVCRKLEKVKRLLNQQTEARRREYQSLEWSQLVSDSTMKPQDYVDAASFLEAKGKYQDAVQCLLKCILVRPDIDSAWLQLSRCYVKVKDFNSAEKTLMRAQQHFAGSPSKQRSILDLLIQCQIEAGQLEDLQESLTRYLKEFPHAEDVKERRQELKNFERDLLAIRIYEDQGFETPIKHLPSMPMRVYIPRKVMASRCKLYTNSVALRFAALAKKALREWASATNQQLSFTLVKTAADADLQCEWTTDLTRRTYYYALAQTKPIVTAKGRNSQKVLIFLDSKKVMSDSFFYATCLHEFGHALGLEHSSHPSDIMYFASSKNFVSGDSQQHLSKWDIDRIKMFFPDPSLAEKAALQFAQAAYVSKEYPTAYELLIPGERWSISLPQFRRQIEDEHTGSRPSFVQIIREYVQDNIVELTLYGSNDHEFFYYDVPVARTASGAYQVLHSRRQVGSSGPYRTFATQTTELNRFGK